MRRLLVLAAIVSAALIVFGVPGCSKKSTQPKSSTGSTVPVSSGTWEVTIQVNSSTGDCDQYVLGTVDTMSIDNGLDDFFADNCNYVITGSRFTHACADTFYSDSACVAVLTYDGGGTFTSTSFNATFAISAASTPPGCSFFPDCVLHVTISGRRLGPEPQTRIRPSARERRGIARLLLRT